MKALALVLLLFASSVVRGEPSADDKAKAKLHFKLGNAYYESGDYRRAADEYAVAYKLMPLPDLIFNSAQSWRLAGEKERAIDLYERYLAVAPAGRGAEESKQWLSELQRDAEVKRARERSEREPAPVSTPSAPTPPPRQEAPRAIAPRAPSSPPSAPAAQSPPSPALAITTKSTERKPLARRAWFWGVIGGGVAVIAGCVALGVVLGKPRDPSPSIGSVTGP